MCGNVSKESTSSAKILVVDDQSDSIFLVRLILEAEGYEVISASNGREALDILHRDLPDSILLDLIMPGMSGFEVIDEIQKNIIFRDIPIIIISAKNEVEDVKLALEKGAVDYIEKPLNDIDLLARLKTSLRLKKNRDDLLAMLNMLHQGIIMVDEDGLVTFLNEVARKILHKEKGENLGKPWADVFPKELPDMDTLKALFEESSRSREKKPIRMGFPDGREYTLEFELRNDPRNRNRQMLLLYDITEIYALRHQLDGKITFHDLIGHSDVMQNVFRRIQDVARVDWTVLVEGETGAGKELVARAIHFAGPRGDMPFVAVNCAGLTDSLLASQLFGHRKGAFTGAINDQKGVFEDAHGGTLFLDEIGDISPNMQQSLLRVLELKEITRVGETQTHKVDVRVIAATHRDLVEEVKKGNFREDLFYRIRIARINIPPLRQRREDIPLLAQKFLTLSRAATGNKVEQISQQAMRRFIAYNWPGNVRELKSAIEFATLFAREPIISLADLPPEINTFMDDPQNFPEMPLNEEDDDLMMAEQLAEKKRFEEALIRAQGSKTQAARILGMSRATFYRKLANMGLDVKE